MTLWWDRTSEFVKSIFNKESTEQLEWILNQTNKYRSSEYIDEIPTRINYLDGDMSDDGLTVLKREFPQTWQDMEKKQVQFPIVKHISNKQAITFRGDGARFYLKDKRTDKEAEKGSDIARTFDNMLEMSGIDTTLPRIDELVLNCHSAAAKTWWDVNKVVVSPYTPDMTHIAVNPDRYWDPYSAFAVAFEQPGYDGLASDSRYEIWGTRNPTTADERDENGLRIYHPTVHYIATKDGQVTVNSEDKNPFKDRATGRPMYPFTWFQDRSDIYERGSHNKTEFNRIINFGLTYLHWQMEWKMASVPAFEAPPGTDLLRSLQGTYVHSPKNAIALPPGVSLKFISPDAETKPFVEVYEALIQYHALMNHLSPKSISIREGLPQSGIALKIELSNLIQFGRERIKRFRPYVIDLLNKMIMVWNTYAPFVPGQRYKRIPENYVPMWDPGQLDTGPVDYIETGNRFIPEIKAGVSTPDHWCSVVHGVDMATAKQMVNANIERNAEIKDLLSQSLVEEVAELETIPEKIIEGKEGTKDALEPIDDDTEPDG